MSSFSPHHNEIEDIKTDIRALAINTQLEIEALSERISRVESSTLSKKRTLEELSPSRAHLHQAKVRAKAPASESSPPSSKKTADREPSPTKSEPPVSQPPAVIASQTSRSSKGELESKLGKVWLVRIGIALLVTGLVLLGNYAYQNCVRELPAWTRLLALFSSAISLCLGGHHLAKKSKFKNFGEVILGGGMAFFYWCSYAAHHVERLQVISSPFTATLLLLLSAGGIFLASIKRQQQSTAIMAIMLATYTTMLTPLSLLTTVSNTILAAISLMLVKRRGWKGTGISALIGSYGSFFWSQITGLSGSSPASCWFLVPLWALFALPGLTMSARHFSESLSPRTRYWLSGLNNGVFFVLFSIAWAQSYSSESFWLVPAIFGSLLTVIGSLGRQKDSSAIVHLNQGIGLLTLALLLKVDGYILPLALAGKSLTLASLFHRFKGKTELTFSALAGLLATGTALSNYRSDGSEVITPFISLAIFALLTCSAFALLWKIDRQPILMANAQRLTSDVLMVCATLVFFVCGWTELTKNQQVTLPAIFAALATIFLVKTRGQIQLPRLEIPVLASLACSLVTLILHELPATSYVISSITSVIAITLWQNNMRPADTFWKPLFLTIGTVSLTMSLYLWSASQPMPQTSLIWSFALIVSVQTLGRFFLKSPALTISATGLLGLQSFTLLPALLNGDDVQAFLPAISGIALIALTTLRHPHPNRVEKISFFTARITTLIYGVLGIVAELPDQYVPNTLAVCAAGLSLLPLILRFKRPSFEPYVLLAISSIYFIQSLAQHGMTLPAEVSLLRHIGLQLSLIFCATAWPRLYSDLEERQKSLIIAAVLSTFLWSTQISITFFGWSCLTLVLSGLGFIYVSIGLWARLLFLRQWGLALLLIAVSRLFLIDIWDYETFTRVIAFIALGVSLICLGFFYNQITSLLKPSSAKDRK